MRGAVAGAWRMRPETGVRAALFEPPPFQPSKLEVTLLPGARVTPATAPPAPRRYTLTHNDLTGELRLSIGSELNARQMGGLYTRLLRDEVVAEWQYGPGAPVLHVHCHVSGQEFWLAPPRLRNYIFRREMALVLDTFVFADRALLAAHPRLSTAQVHCHFHSHVAALQRSEAWGTLGDRASWVTLPSDLPQRLNLLLFGFPAAASAAVARRTFDCASAAATTDAAAAAAPSDADASERCDAQGPGRASAATSGSGEGAARSNGAAMRSAPATAAAAAAVEPAEEGMTLLGRWVLPPGALIVVDETRGGGPRRGAPSALQPSSEGGGGGGGDPIGGVQRRVSVAVAARGVAPAQRLPW